MAAHQKTPRAYPRTLLAVSSGRERSNHRPVLGRAVNVRVQIVDPRYEDYDGLLELAASARLDLGFTRTGHAALRTGRLLGVDLWVVNAKLPDMSGFDLLGMLRSTRADSTVFVVDNAYRFDSEQRAMMLQAAQYLCKPVAAPWLADWSGAFHLTRAGPLGVPP